MRDINEKATLDTDQLRRARFAYYAETQKFLPFTPEGKQRQIVKDYNNTLIVQNFTFSGTSTFTLAKSARFLEEIPIESLSIWSRHCKYSGNLFTVAGGIFLFSFTNAQSN